MAEKYFSTLTGKELDDALKAALNVKSTIQTELQTAKDSGEFDGPPGEDGMNPYEYAIQNGYEYAESTFIMDFLAALSSEEYEEVFMGEDLTEFDAYRDAFAAEKAVFHRDNNGLVYIASAADTAQISFYCIDKDGAIRCAALNSKKEWIYYTVEAGNVFVGDETTTLAEFYEADNAGKVCFMRRPQGGSGYVTWIASAINASNAHFYKITTTGKIQYGYLDKNNTFTYQTASGGDVDLTGYATEEWVKGYALPSTYTPPNQTAAQVGADPVGTAVGAVSDHNTDTDSHADLRLELKALTDRLNAFFDSDNQTLDELSEIVAYITSNKALIDAITTSKVSVADIINNLTTNVVNKPLSAAQGVALKALIDAITVPTKLSQLSGDSTHRVVTDTEKAAWNAKSNFSGKYEDLSGKPTIPTVPTKVSAFENDAGYLTQKDKTIYYIEGTGDTAGTWLGSHPDIKEYTPGLTVLYKVPVAGASPTTLNINNLGAVTVVRNATTSVSTNYPVNSIVTLTYTVDSGTAYFKQADYDANTKTSAGTSNKTGTKMFLVGAASQTSSGTTTYSNTNCYIGTNNRLYSGGEVVPNTADINALIDAKIAAFPDASEVEY